MEVSVNVTAIVRIAGREATNLNLNFLVRLKRYE